GGSIVWYTLVFLLFRLGQRFFNAETFIFVFFLSVACGAAYYGWQLLLAPLQDLNVDAKELFHLSFLQAIVLPTMWFLGKCLRPKVEKTQLPTS
ncbi:MAG: hypothetical protein IJS50_03135, partial [Desulfovibrio sp.]|nr:hypothetical protein [Desulfovibrio sp.]